ncbi:MAG: hypothetical protein V1766_12135 [Pseudomonadota bacterium]
MANGQQTAASEPKPYWRPLRPGETVYILNDIVEGPEETQGLSPVINKQGIKDVSRTAPWIAPVQIPENIEALIRETAERLVRDMAPDIIERVVREEIEKLKMEVN